MAAQPARQSVGLVLSGGGSKGIAHIGVLQALEDNDIPVDYIAGTSMGAIVGGLYAAGYTPAEMLDLILSDGFGYWSTGKIDPNLTYYFYREPASPVMLSVPVARKDTTNSVFQSVISPLPMNFAFMDLFSAYTAQCGGDFDRLFVPFRCVASDVDAHRKAVLGSGSLGDAIRASMSFPLVFQPTVIDGRVLYDGGIYDNFPVDVMQRSFAPSFIFGVTVNTPTPGPPTSFMDQLDNLVIQREDYSLPADCGIKLHIDLSRFGLLDFPKARQIYRIGYDKAMEMMDSLKTRITSRTPAETRRLRRAIFKSQTPYVRFDRVNVTGGTPRQNDYISYLFRPAAGSDTIGIPCARDAFYRAISSGKLSDLQARAVYNDSTDLFALDLKAAVKGSFKVGFGGYITSSTGSYIYLTAGYSSLSFRSLNASVSGWIGQSDMAGTASARVYLHTPLPSAIGVQAVASRRKFYETEHAFYDDKTPTFIINNEYFGRLMWSVATGRTGSIDAGVGYGSLHSSYYRDNTAESYQLGRDRSHYSLGQAFVRFTSSTLDNLNYPTSGHSYYMCAMGLMGRNSLEGTNNSVTHPEWLQAEVRTRNYFDLGRLFSLGLEADLMLSTRRPLPTYSASIATAPAFLPTPASNNAFNPSMRAYNFLGAGVVPVVKLSSSLSARVGAYGFVPFRQLIRTDALTDACGRDAGLGKFRLLTEADVTYQFPFASLSGYINYANVPGDKWHVGLSFGIYLAPPSFLQ